MVKLTKLLFSIFLALLVFISCENEMEKYYERPSSLDPPIYKQLQESGRFTLFLQCVDLAGYKDVLDRTGYLTVFCPNDSAFNAWLTSKSITISDVDVKMARKIVTYSMLYNSYKTTDFDRYQSGVNALDSSSFKRKTYYYKGFYYGNVKNNAGAYELSIIADNNRNSIPNVNDNNNKYIPVFNKAFFDFNRLAASDYTTFFPGSTYTGMNVANAKITHGDNFAQNGIWHEVDKVLEPLPNLDDIIASNSNYSLFKQLLDTLVVYQANTDLYKKYLNTPNNEVQNLTNAYYKIYYNLSFSPNNENFVAATEDGQSNDYTMFVPDNTSLDKALKERIAVYYGGDFKRLPLGIINTFVRAHQFPQTIWPSSINSGKNFNEEPPRFNISNVNTKIFGSNGIFYGTDKIQSHDYFMTVFGDIYLNPGNTMYLYAVNNLALLSKTISNPADKRFSLFILNDVYLKSIGFEFKPDRAADPLYYQGIGTIKNSRSPQDTLKNLVTLYITDEVADLSGSGFMETVYGDIIGYNNNTIFGSGNLDNGEVIKCYTVPEAKPNNGTVYLCDTTLANKARKLKLTTKNVGFHLQKYFNTTKFWTYFSVNTIYNATTQAIDGYKSGVLYTILVPNDAAIDQAIADGYLPANPTTGDQAKIKRFIQYHIIKNKAIIANGSKNAKGGFLTMLALGVGSAQVTVNNTVGNLSFTDQKGNTVSWVPASSNVLSNKTVIHTINGYLKY
jgi:uncharacterized surface protein with fasciclin (FAS1) repeats